MPNKTMKHFMANKLSFFDKSLSITRIVAIDPEETLIMPFCGNYYGFYTPFLPVASAMTLQIDLILAKND